MPGMRASVILLLFFCLVTRSTAGICAEDPILLLDKYLREQTIGLPGKVSFSISLPDLSRLPACSTYQPFSPPGARAMGRTTLGLRCLAPMTWSILVPVSISVTANYVITARALTAGQTIQAGDLTTQSGDLATLPGNVITSPEAAIGKTLRNSLTGGLPLRADQLLAQLVVRQGQAVRVVTRGEGFAVSSEGKAINNASLGQVVQVRLNSGQTVSGIAREDGSVEIVF
jgi:flagella basal body P-ring formation protein FlgA